MFTHAKDHLVGFGDCGEINSKLRNSSALGLMDIDFLSMLPAFFNCGLTAHPTASIKYVKLFPKFIKKRHLDQNTPSHQDEMDSFLVSSDMKLPVHLLIPRNYISLDIPL